MIQDICNTFFSTTHTPILVMNNDFFTICNIGHDVQSMELIKSVDIKNLISKGGSTNKILKLDKAAYITVVYTKINFNMQCDFHVIIGPISTEDISSYKTSSENILREESYPHFLINLFYLLFNNLFTNKSKTYSPCINQAINYIHANYQDNISPDKICKEINISKSYFCSIFKKETGYTFITYLNLYRIERSKLLLKNTNKQILDIALSVGYESQSYFCRIFKKYVGVSPLKFRTNHVQNIFI